jgi:ABC-type Co2+ transport system permease subunit
MHIEPGVVNGAKITLSYATACGGLGLAAKMAYDSIKNDGGVASLAVRSVISTALVFSFFELLPHHPVGVSEVHLILGSTLFLIFGGGAAAIGLAAGLLMQGVLFAPADLPGLLARKMIPAKTAYKDVTYGQALALSTSYQAGIVGWVAFWALYGHGFSLENLAQIGSFGAAYMTVILVEPLIDLAVLAVAKALPTLRGNMALHNRLFTPAA